MASNTSPLLQLPPKLIQLLKTGELLIFLGAGYSKDSGVPLWNDALSSIARELSRRHPKYAKYAELMQSQAENGQFLEAAEVFYLASLLPMERQDILDFVFNPQLNLSRRQKKLLHVGCQGFITTNFDRSIELAAPPRLLRFIESDSDLDQARVASTPYCLRLHGRIESSDGLIFSKHQYARALSRNSYIEFFRNLFTQRNVLFFGFSFSDPIWTHLIQEMSRALHSVFRRQAFALLPGPLNHEIESLCRQACISAIAYDPREDHKQAWDTIIQSSSAVVSVSPEARQIEQVRSELATVYARAKARNFSADRGQVLSGLLVPLLRDIGIGGSVEIPVFLEKARELLALPNSVPDTELMDALRRLESDSLVKLSASSQVYVASLPDISLLGKDLDNLVDDIYARAAARYQFRLDTKYKHQLAEVLTAAVIIDGLHVAYSFIRGRPLEDWRLQETIQKALRLTNANADLARDEITQAFQDLLTRPDREQEILLASLSSLAFSITLLLSDPIFAVEAKARVRDGIILDANVLLPWLAEGHPSAPLSSAIVKAFGRGGVYTLPVYIEEIVWHRKLALEAYSDGGLAKPSRFELYVRLFHAGGINAFLGAYSEYSKPDLTLTFEEYLQKVAPFTDQTSATKFLESKGIKLFEAKVHPERLSGGPIIGELKSVFREADSDRAVVVVQHDAQLVDSLRSYLPQEECPYFVTNDRRLVSAIAQTRAKDILTRVLLPQQALYLAELLGRAQANISGLTRTVWMSQAKLPHHIREYYIDRILREYEHALVEDIPVIVDELMTEIHNSGLAQLREPKQSLTEAERVSTFKDLDRFEPEFYKKLMAAKARHGL